MNKIYHKRGYSRMIVLLALLAVGVLGAIVLINSRSNDGPSSIDADALSSQEIRSAKEISSDSDNAQLSSSSSSASGESTSVSDSGRTVTQSSGNRATNDGQVTAQQLADGNTFSTADRDANNSAAGGGTDEATLKAYSTSFDRSASETDRDSYDADSDDVSDEETEEDELNGLLSIAGQVLNEFGEPVGGIDVIATVKRLFDDPSGSSFGGSPPEQATRTDFSGYYYFDNLPNGEYEIRTVAMNYYLPASITVRAGVNAAQLVVVEQLEVWIDGIVTSTGGQRLSGVNVLASGAGKVVSDANGAFRFPLLVRSDRGVLIRLQAEGYQEGKVSLSRRDWEDSGGELLLEFVMEPLQAMAEVSGRVVSESGRPVAGEQVYLKLNQKYKTTTDSSGQFLFDAVESGNGYKLWLVPKGPYAQYQEDGLQIGSGGLSGLEIVLESVGVGRVKGQMLNMDGRPVPNFTLSVSSEAVRSASLSVTSDGGGYFAINGVPEGRVRFQSQSFPRFVTSGVELSAGSEVEVDLLLDLGNQQVSGRVTDELGQPIPGANLTLSWVLRENGLLHESLRKVTTSADGSFIFTQLGGVTRDLIVSAPGYETVTMKGVGGTAAATLEIPLKSLPE